MKLIGQPFAIQNTDSTRWLITWDALETSEGERIAFTVAIPKNAELSLADMERHALKRAVELLQEMIRAGQRGS